MLPLTSKVNWRQEQGVERWVEQNWEGKEQRCFWLQKAPRSRRISQHHHLQVHATSVYASRLVLTSNISECNDIMQNTTKPASFLDHNALA